MATIKDTLFKLFDLDKMEPEKAAEMVDRLGKLVFQAALMRTLPMLSEEDMDEYEKVLEENNAEVLFKFMNDKVPDFGKIIDEEAEILRVELAGEFEEAGM